MSNLMPRDTVDTSITSSSQNGESGICSKLNVIANKKVIIFVLSVCIFFYFDKQFFNNMQPNNISIVDVPSTISDNLQIVDYDLSTTTLATTTTTAKPTEMHNIVSNDEMNNNSDVIVSESEQKETQQSEETKSEKIENTDVDRCKSFKKFGNYSIALVTRTYAGDLKRMKKWLLPTYQMFVDTKCIEIVFVFDDEPEDRKVGEMLREKYGYKIYYEPLPSDYQRMLNTTWIFHGKYANLGYNRQLWSTWWTDNYTNADIVGPIDSDAMIYSMMTIDTILNENGNIIAQSTLPDHYKGDEQILGFENFDWFDFMWIDRLPQWYWRETFENARNYLKHKWNGNSFDDAYAKFAITRYSEFNCLYDYAMKFEQDKYESYPCEDSKGVISVGCNRCREHDILLGCCYNFGKDVSQKKCPDNGLKNVTDFEFLWRYNNCNAKWTTHNKVRIIDHYNVSLNERLNEMEQSDIEKMKQSCHHYLLTHTKKL